MTKAEAAFVLKDFGGHVLGAGSFNLDGATITFAEAIGLKEGLKLAKAKGIWKLIMKGDSKVVIEAVLDNWDVPGKIKTIIEKARFIVASFWRVEWRHAFWEANFVANALAHFGLTLTSPHIWHL